MPQTKKHLEKQPMRTIWMTLSVILLWQVHAIADVTIGAGATVNLNNNANVTVTGDLTNNGTFDAGPSISNITLTGDLTNNGTFDAGPSKIYITGDWTNNGTFDDSTSTVIFNGTTTQTVAGTAGEEFYRFTVDKSGGDLVLNSHITIERFLTMTNGNIDTNGFTLTLVGIAPGSLNHTNGVIIGDFERYIWSSLQNYDFPVGTASDSRKVTINFGNLYTPGGSLKVSHVDAGVNFVKLSPKLVDFGYSVTQRSQMYWLVVSSGLSFESYKLTVEANGQQQIADDGSELRLLRSINHVNFSTPNGSPSRIPGPTVRRTGISTKFPWFAYIGQGYDSGLGVNAPPLIPAAGSFGPTTIYEGETDTGFFAYTYDASLGDQVRFTFSGGDDWWGAPVTTDYVPTDADGLTELVEFYPPDPPPPPTGGAAQTYYIQVRAEDDSGNISSWSVPIEVTVIDDRAGQQVDLSLLDDGSEEATLLFNFPFYGVNYDKVWINANGNLTFGGGSAAWGESVSQFLDGIPAASNGMGLPSIAAWWDDLNPEQAAPGDLVSYTNYTDKTVITYSNIPQPNAGDANSFSITLHSSGKIELSGYNLAPPNEDPDGIVGISPGGEVTGNRVTFTRETGSYTGAIYEDFSNLETLPPSAVITFTPNGPDSYTLNSDGAIVSFSLGYDSLDNPTFIRRTDQNGPDRTLTADYDDLSRVIKVVYDDGITVDETTFEYGSDGAGPDLNDPLGKVGNRTRKQSSLDPGATQYAYATDSNQLTSRSYAPDHFPGFGGLYYEYDLDGNLERKHDSVGTNYQHVFDYDVVGRLKQVDIYDENGMLDKSVQYFYDGDGNRVKVIDDGVTRYFQYSGGQKLLELNSSKTVTAYYVHGPDGILYRKKTTGAEEIEYHHKDWLGGTTLLTDDSQQVVDSYYYNIFGDLRWSLGSGSDNTHKFTGKEFDDGTNLYDSRWRDYDPYIGRFTSRDPAFDGVNWYIYVRNNPLKYTDPTGLRIQLSFRIGTTTTDVQRTRQLLHQIERSSTTIGARVRKMRMDPSVTTTIEIYPGLPPLTSADTGIHNPSWWSRLAVYTGIGVDAIVSNFDPSLSGFYSDGAPRTALTVLAHELLHAYELNYGQARFKRFGPTKSRELSTTYLENEFRHSQGIGQRRLYGWQGSWWYVRQYKDEPYKISPK